jgi:hypothetical protein
MPNVQFESTQADIQAFQRFVVSRVRGFTSKASLGLSWRPIALGVPVGIGVLVAGRLAAFELDGPTAAVSAIVFVAFWIFFRMRFSRAMAAAERGSLLGARQVALDDKGVSEESVHHKHMSDWLGVLSIDETDAHIFLMIDRFAGYIVPKRAFSNAARLQEFVAFARDRAGADVVG